MSDDGVLTITGRMNEQYKRENGKFVVPGPIDDGLRLWSPFIAQAFIYGLNRPHNVLLVVPDTEACAAELDLDGDAAQPENIANNPDVLHLIETEINEALSEVCKPYAQPRGTKILSEAFSVESGLLTPKMSMKRRVIAERYADTLDSMY